MYTFFITLPLAFSNSVSDQEQYDDGPSEGPALEGEVLLSVEDDGLVAVMAFLLLSRSLSSTGTKVVCI